MNKAVHLKLILLSILWSLEGGFLASAEPENLAPTIIDVDTGKHKAALTPNGWVGERVWRNMSGFNEGVCPVQAELGGKWGAIDVKGNLIVPLEYDFVSECHGGLLAVRKGEAWGYLKSDGSTALPFSEEWESADVFRGMDRAVVKKEGLYGYINPKGEVVIPTIYEKSYDFAANAKVAWVKKGGLFGLIDAQGREASPFRWADVGAFSENRACVRSNDGPLLGFIDENGNEVIKPIYDAAGTFQDGMCNVRKAGKWFFIDLSGSVRSTVEADKVWTSARGLSKIQIGNRYGLVSLDGKLVEPPKWKGIYHASGTYTVLEEASEDLRGMYAVRGPDGKLSASIAGLVREPTNMKPLLTINPGTHPSGFAMSVDRTATTLLTSSSGDNIGRLWRIDSAEDTPSLSLLHVLRPPLGGVRDGVEISAISPDGAIAALAGFGGNVFVYDVKTGKLVRRIPTVGEVVLGIKFSDSGRYLAVGTWLKHSLSIFEAHTGKLLCMDTHYASGPNSICWIDDRQVISGGLDVPVRLYDVPDFNKVSSSTPLNIEHQHALENPAGAKVLGLSLSSDNKRLAVTYTDSNIITVHSASTLMSLGELKTTTGYNTGFSRGCWLKSGELAVGGNWATEEQTDANVARLLCTARIWPASAIGSNQVPTRAKIAPQNIQLKSATIFDIVEIGESSLLVCDGDGMLVNLNKDKRGKYKSKVLFNPPVPAFNGLLEFTPLDPKKDADLIAQGEVYREFNPARFRIAHDASAVQFDFQTGRNSAIISVPDLKLKKVDINNAPDNFITPRTVSDRIKVTGWLSARNPKLNGKSLIPNSTLDVATSTCLTIAPNDEFFLLGSTSGLRCFTPEGKLKWIKVYPCFAVALSQDTRLSVVAGLDGIIRWLDANSGDELLAYFAHTDEKRWILWSPQGYFACSAGAEDLIGWHVNLGVDHEQEYYLGARLWSSFYRPDIVQEVLKQRRGAGEIAKDMGITFSLEAALKKVPVVKLQGASDGETMGTDTAVILLEAWDTGGGVKDISLFHNGKRIPQDGPGQRRGEVRTLSYTVMLQPGENELKAQAANDAGTISNPAIARVKFNGVQATSTLHLLTIGLNRYQNPKYNLTYCAADADACAEAFAKRAPGLFAEVKSYALRDDQATKPKIEETFGQIAKAAKPSDVFIFCYAGHGVMGEKPEGKPGDNEFYLLPHDVTRMYGDPEMLAEKGVSKADLETWCTNIPARKQIMLLDTCQSGGLVDTYAMRGVAEEKAIAMLARASGTMVIASTGAEAYARESKDIGHGIFTQALLDGLLDAKADADKDGKITVKEIDTYIGSAVPELSQKLVNSPQFPTSYARGQDFPIGIVK